MNKSKYYNKYSSKSEYSKFSNYKYFTQFKALHNNEEIAEAVSGMRTALRKIYYRMDKAGVDSIEMGQIRQHYGIDSNGKLKIPNIKRMINGNKYYERNGKRVHNPYYGKYRTTELLSEYEWISQMLNNEYYSVKGAKEQLENTKRVMQEHNVDFDEENFGFQEQHDLWELFAEFREFVPTLGTQVVMDTIIEESTIGGSISYEELRSNIYNRLSQMARDKGYASDILNH